MQKNLIYIAQLISLVVMWIFVIGIAIWILNLISISVELHDVPGVSIGISIIAIPVFFTIASILTYVFLGLQKDYKSNSKTSLEG